MNIAGETLRIPGIVEALAPLAGSLEDRQAGLALANALQALAGLQPNLRPAADVLQGLVAVSTDTVSLLLCCLFTALIS